MVCWLTEELRSSRARVWPWPTCNGRRWPRGKRAALEEKTAAEQSLRQSEQQLRLVIDGAPVFIAYCDREHRYRFVNRGYAERFGLTREQIIGKRISEVVGPSAYERLKPYIEQPWRGSWSSLSFRLTSRNSAPAGCTALCPGASAERACRRDRSHHYGCDGSALYPGEAAAKRTRVKPARGESSRHDLSARPQLAHRYVSPVAEATSACPPRHFLERPWWRRACRRM